MMAEPEAGPAEREVTNLRFHQLTRLRIFDKKPETLTPQQRCQLLAVSSKYGFTFVGCDTGLKILKTADISKLSDQHQDSPNTAAKDYPCLKVTLSANAQPVNLALSPDDLILSVCYMTDSGLLMALFDVRTLVYKSINAKPFATATLSKETDCQLVNLLWNPGNPTFFATCLSDGNLALWDYSGDSLQMTYLLPSDVEPTAMCWSPKGKQIVVGTSSGKLIQYNLKLEQKKLISPPDFSEPTKVVDILWLSTYVFAVAYIDAEETLQPNLTIVNAPKEGRPTYSNFEDVCYGSGETRTAQYQLLNAGLLEKWSFILATSSNSMEAAVIGQSREDRASWEIWTVDDAARIEMPLSGDDEDTFPMGLALDLSSETDVKIGTTNYQAPPIVMVLSTEGVLCPFYILNSDATVPITSKAEPLPREGERVASGQAVGLPSQTQASKPAAAPDTAKPTTSFTAALPIHKSSSTGSFPLGSSSSSSSTPTGSSDRSASFSFAGPKPLGSPAAPSFVSGGIFNRPDAGGSGGNASFMFGKTADGKSGSASFLPPKQSPASTNLAPTTPSPGAAPFQFKVPGAQDTTEKGLPIQQPASAQATPQFRLPGQSVSSVSPLASGTQNSTAPASAFAITQQKTALDAASTFGGGGMLPQTDSVKASGSARFGQPQPGQVPVSGKPAPSQALPTAQTAPPPGGAPPNQIAPPRTGPAPNQVTPGFAQNQIAPRFAPNQVAPGAPPNQVAPQQGYPYQVAPPGAISKPPPPAYSASQPQRQAVPETKPPPPVQAPSTEASTARTGGRTRGSGSIDATHVEAACLSNISAEMEHLTKELAELQSHTRRTHFRVGERSEHEYIKKNTDDLVKFRAEVRVVTKSHNEEIHELKSKLLTTFAQCEDARTFKQRNSNPRYLQLLRIRGLDPQTSQQLRNIQSNYHYLETGLGDVNGCLDAQWEEFHQRKSRREGRKLGTPTMDTIYQTLSHHYNIMIAQRGKLEELRQQLIQARRYDITKAPWEKGILASPPDRSGDLTSLAAKLSSTRIASPVKAISTPVSSKKQAQLRKALSRRATTPRRTASRVDISLIDSPAPSHGSHENLYPVFANRRLQYQDEESTVAQPASRETRDAADAPYIRTVPGFVQARLGSGIMAPAGLASRRQEGMEVRSSAAVEPKQHTPVSPTESPPAYPEPPPPSSQPLPAATTSPSSFTHSGRGTVVWGTQTTPLKTPPATRCPPTSAMLRKGVEKQPELPPVVNIKNLDVSQSTRLPPPVSFATVNGSVDAGTVKVVNQVLAEMAKTSGYSQPEASEQTAERKISFSDEPPPIVQPVPPSMPILIKAAGGGSTAFSFGASKPPVVQSLPANASAIPPAATTSPPTFGGSNTGLGLTFGGSGSMFGAKKEDSSTSVSTATQPGLSSFSFAGGVGSAKATIASSTAPTATSALPVMSDTASSKPVFGGASFTTSAAKTSTSSGFSLTAQPASSVGAGGSSAATVPGVKPSLFDFKDQKSAASTSTPGGFFVSPTSSLKEPIQDKQVPEATTSPATTISSTEASTSKPTSNLNFSVKSLITMPPAAQALQPTQAIRPTQAVQPAQPTGSVAPTASTSNAGGVRDAGIKQFSGMGMQPAVSAAQGGLKQLLVGEDEAGTGLASKPQFTGFASSAVSQTVGEDEAGTGRPAAAIEASDTYDNAPPAAAQPTTSAATTASGLFGKPVATPTDGTSGSLFGAKTASVAPFGMAATTAATVATPATSGSAAGFSAPSFGAAPSAGLFGAPKFGASTQPSVSSPTATTAATSTAADKPKMPSTLFGLLKEDQPTSSASGSPFGATTSTASSSVSKNLFGQPTSTSASPFGQSTTTSSGIFGQSATSASSSSGLFGKPVSRSTGQIFGQAATSTSTGGVFGQPAATTGVFGQPAATSSGGIFGQSSPAASSPFQQAGSGSGGVFGTSSSGPTFGQQSAGVFGRPSSAGPTFGQSPSVFGQTPAATPSSSGIFGGSAGGDGGGGFFSGLGGRPNPEAARSNPFGSPAVSAPGFGGSSTGGSTLFGSQGASTFGTGTASSPAGSVFGGGFSSPEGGVAKAGFGGFNQPPSASAGGFGSPPAFGSTAAFGSTPAFGGSAFGSSGAGQPSPFGQASAFGAGAPQASGGMSGGFSGFASQETPTFGALSGTGTKPQQSGLGGFGAGSSQSGFGGTGFGGGGGQSNNTSSGFGGSSSFTQYR
ncbi:nuclear pore complex protein Nup214-like isoform X2 [Patiria miniata]|uniref:Nuclear pore complex protein Nup214 n=1 Tax=Patiria miniata TaxID=46514 RepID=A0A914AJD4_PATMI|nr:nuclear pore complex protein Nup214-like isoform X2 [Patiria miniata]